MVNYVRCLFGVSFIAMAIILIRKLVGNRMSKSFVYGMWMTIPVFMCISPFVRLPVPQALQDVTKPVVTWIEYSSIDKNIDVFETVEVTNAEENINLLNTSGVKESVAGISMKECTIHTTDTNNTINAASILCWIYWGVVVLLTGTIFLINLRFIVQCRQNREFRCQSPDVKLSVYQLKDITSPFLQGRSIYVPVGMRDEELRYAILHEEGHFKHGDPFWVVMRYFVLVLHFYNPIIWMAFRYSGYDCELACDEEVMKAIQANERKVYGGCLLSTIEKRMRVQNVFLLSANMKSDRSLIKERIENIANKRKKSSIAMLLATTIVVSVMGASLMGETEIQAKGQISSEQKTDTKQEQLVQNEDSDVVKSGDVVQACIEIWSRPIEETEERYTIEENGRELELMVDGFGQDFVGKSVGETVLRVKEIEGMEYKYFYTILGINDVAGTSYQMPNEWKYHFTTKQNGYIEDNPDQWTGYRKFYVNAEASSTLPPQGEFGYEPVNVTIPEAPCIWSEGAFGDGIGEYIEIRQLYMGPGEEILTFNQLCIVNGYAENEKKWQENNRVKRLALYYEDVYMGTIALEDTQEPQYIDITPLQMKVKNGREATFRFEIEEVYEGTKYDDTCISTIAIDFKGHK